MRQQVLLAPGRFGSLSWNRRGEPTGDIRYQVHEQSLELDYRYREHGGADWLQVNEHVPFDFTDQKLGGRRRWFLCRRCRRRCAVLYGGAYFRCRKCHNLAYQSQNESPMWRALSQAQKLRMRLGGSGSMDEPFPPKPRGMHWRTYHKLGARGNELDSRVWAMEMRWFRDFNESLG